MKIQPVQKSQKQCKGLKVATFGEFLLSVDTLVSEVTLWGEGGSHEGLGSFSKAITLYQDI